MSINNYLFHWIIVNSFARFIEIRSGWIRAIKIASPTATRWTNWKLTIGCRPKSEVAWTEKTWRCWHRNQIPIRPIPAEHTKRARPICWGARARDGAAKLPWNFKITNCQVLNIKGSPSTRWAGTDASAITNTLCTPCSRTSSCRSRTWIPRTRLGWDTKRNWCSRISRASSW